jgi:hypothetical protein
MELKLWFGELEKPTLPYTPEKEAELVAEISAEMDQQAFKELAQNARDRGDTKEAELFESRIVTD